MIERENTKPFWLDVEVICKTDGQSRRFGAWVVSLDHLRELLVHHGKLGTGDMFHIFTDRKQPPEQNDTDTLYSF